MSSGSSPETKYRICRFCRLNCRWTALQTRKYLAPTSADKTLHCPVKYSEMRSSQEVLSRMDKKDSTASALILFSIEAASSRSSSSLNPDVIALISGIGHVDTSRALKQGHYCWLDLLDSHVPYPDADITAAGASPPQCAFVSHHISSS